MYVNVAPNRTAHHVKLWKWISISHRAGVDLDFACMRKMCAIKLLLSSLSVEYVHLSALHARWVQIHIISRRKVDKQKWLCLQMVCATSTVNADNIYIIHTICSFSFLSCIWRAARDSKSNLNDAWHGSCCLLQPAASNERRPNKKNRCVKWNRFTYANRCSSLSLPASVSTEHNYHIVKMLEKWIFFQKIQFNFGLAWLWRRWRTEEIRTSRIIEFISNIHRNTQFRRHALALSPYPHIFDDDEMMWCVRVCWLRPWCSSRQHKRIATV